VFGFITSTCLFLDDLEMFGANLCLIERDLASFGCWRSPLASPLVLKNQKALLMVDSPMVGRSFAFAFAGAEGVHVVDGQLDSAAVSRTLVEKAISRLEIGVKRLQLGDRILLIVPVMSRGSSKLLARWHTAVKVAFFQILTLDVPLYQLDLSPKFLADFFADPDDDRNITSPVRPQSICSVLSGLSLANALNGRLRTASGYKGTATMEELERKITLSPSKRPEANWCLPPHCCSIVRRIIGQLIASQHHGQFAMTKEELATALKTSTFTVMQGFNQSQRSCQLLVWAGDSERLASRYFDISLPRAFNCRVVRKSPTPAEYQAELRLWEQDLEWYVDARVLVVPALMQARGDQFIAASIATHRERVALSGFRHEKGYLSGVTYPSLAHTKCDDCHDELFCVKEHFSPHGLHTNCNNGTCKKDHRNFHLPSELAHRSDQDRVGKTLKRGPEDMCSVDAGKYYDGLPPAKRQTLPAHEREQGVIALLAPEYDLDQDYEMLHLGSIHRQLAYAAIGVTSTDFILQEGLAQLAKDRSMMEQLNFIGQELFTCRAKYAAGLHGAAAFDVMYVLEAGDAARRPDTDSDAGDREYDRYDYAGEYDWEDSFCNPDLEFKDQCTDVMWSGF